MSNFNVKYILPGDNKDTIILKTNYNFNQLLFNGIGKPGEIGDLGPTGIIGQVGRDGNLGTTGDRASNWYFSYIQPAVSDSNNGDLWVNLGPSGYQDVSRYNNGVWSYSGSLLSTSVFNILEGISGPANLSDYNAVYIKDALPGNYTVVLSDRNGETGDVNPTLAKLLIDTNGANVQYPIFAFAKTFRNQIDLPGLYWASSLPDNYSIKYTSDSKFTVSSGATASFSATGGTVSLVSGVNMNIESGGSFALTGGTASFASVSSMNITSSNINVSTNAFDVNVTGVSTIINNSTDNSVTYTGKANGLYVSSTTEESSESLLGNTGASGGSIFKIRNDGPIIIGSSGPTGPNTTDNGLIVKDLQITSYTIGPKFLKNGVYHSYVEVVPSKDNISITPSAKGNAAPPVANGDTGRLYLSLGSDFSWIGLPSSNERTLNFFLASDKYSFGGIRMKQSPPWSDITVAIPDGGTGATAGCRHIELTFFSGNTKAFYRAFAGGATGPDSYFKCGWISYVYVRPGQIIDEATGVNVEVTPGVVPK